MPKFSLMLFLLLILSAPAFSAGGQKEFRCAAGRIIHVGDSKLEVLEKCGEPLLKDVVSQGDLDVKIEDWSYKGTGDFNYRVRFTGSSVSIILNDGR
jgi:hypothetical protein